MSHTHVQERTRQILTKEKDHHERMRQVQEGEAGDDDGDGGGGNPVTRAPQLADGAGGGVARLMTGVASDTALGADDDDDAAADDVNDGGVATGAPPGAAPSYRAMVRGRSYRRRMAVEPASASGLGEDSEHSERPGYAAARAEHLNQMGGATGNRVGSDSTVGGAFERFSQRHRDGSLVSERI